MRAERAGNRESQRRTVDKSPTIPKRSPVLKAGQGRPRLSGKRTLKGRARGERSSGAKAGQARAGQRIWGRRAAGRSGNGCDEAGGARQMANQRAGQPTGAGPRRGMGGSRRQESGAHKRERFPANREGNGRRGRKPPANWQKVCGRKSCGKAERQGGAARTRWGMLPKAKRGAGKYRKPGIRKCQGQSAAAGRIRRDGAGARGTRRKRAKASRGMGGA